MRRQPDPEWLIPAVVMALLIALAFLLPLVLSDRKNQTPPAAPLPHSHKYDGIGKSFRPFAPHWQSLLSHYCYDAGTPDAGPFSLAVRFPLSANIDS